jgi:hypothetical protein
MTVISETKLILALIPTDMVQLETPKVQAVMVTPVNTLLVV